MSPNRTADQNTEDQKHQAKTRRANPDSGPAMSQAGAMPSGSEMKNWKTAMPNPDATRPETMPTSATQSRSRGKSKKGNA